MVVYRRAKTNHLLGKKCPHLQAVDTTLMQVAQSWAEQAPTGKARAEQ